MSLRRAYLQLFKFLLIFSSTIVFASEGGESGVHHEPGIFDLIGPGVNFLIYAFLLYWFVGRKVPGFLRKRKEALLKEIQESKQKKEEAEKLYQEFTGRLNKVQEESEKLMETARQDAEVLRQRILREADQQREKILIDAREAASREMLKAKQNLRKEVLLLAVELAETMARNQVTDQDQKRFVETIIEEVKH